MQKLSEIIQSYKARNVLRKADPQYRNKIDGLASELAEYKNEPMSLECPSDYFTYYCYVYLNPLKPGRFEYLLPSGKRVSFLYEPFYAGKGKRNRCNVHLFASTKGDNRLKSHIIKKIQAAGQQPIVKVMGSRVSTYVSLAFEVDLIAGIGRRDQKQGPLANMTDGGDGRIGKKDSEETRRKKSAASKGKPKTKAHNLAVSRAHKGVPLSASHIEAIRNRIMPNSIAVRVGDVIYPTQAKAARALGITSQSLSYRIASPNYPDHSRV